MSALSAPAERTPAVNAAPVKKVSAYAGYYHSLKLDSLQLSREAFDYAVQGYERLKAAGELENDKVLSIVDFSLPSSRKRLFIVDIKTGKLLYHTYVSHGRNSGEQMATRFSNRPESFQSSLGFYVTGDTYKGQHGYSLQLDGQEHGINDNALMRKIVVHAAAYVSERNIAQQGFLGRSLGCPAVPEKLSKPIINTIRGGSCLFIYSTNQQYIAQSKMLVRPALAAIDTLPSTFVTNS
ncbi:MAG: murein L,D-transpeptidase catalytic domain family protein [Candidatus Pseudobacter hemicellulosilyticus]|uniref:Murein L,D-transpeptidase catalytic domain family protein n=1 Tax=Candidatus Pseudobacter hemicellulosilyticus TaxID=3121375 RepID=A0AAJ5WUW4_9BACT|nr:MAG: murein L,D-transpeptidase catalytic domain family protein [Pseudobacter sp.]